MNRPARMAPGPGSAASVPALVRAPETAGARTVLLPDGVGGVGGSAGRADAALVTLVTIVRGGGNRRRIQTAASSGCRAGSRGGMTGMKPAGFSPVTRPKEITSLAASSTDMSRTRTAPRLTKRR